MPSGDVVCRRPDDEAALELALIALAALACPPPATRQTTRALMRRCAEPAAVLASAGWTSADVAAWIADDLRATPVRGVRDPNAMAGHLLGKAAAAAAAGTKSPTQIKAAQAARAAATRAAAAAQAREQDAARRAAAALTAEALPHLEHLTPGQRLELMPQLRGGRRWTPDDLTDLDDLPDEVLANLAWAWHDSVCDDEMAAHGWEAVAAFADAADVDLSWVAEKIRQNQGPPDPWGARSLRTAWCAAHHTHAQELTR